MLDAYAAPLDASRSGSPSSCFQDLSVHTDNLLWSALVFEVKRSLLRARPGLTDPRAASKRHGCCVTSFEYLLAEVHPSRCVHQNEL